MKALSIEIHASLERANLAIPILEISKRDERLAPAPFYSALYISPDNSMCLSGSSDTTIHGIAVIIPNIYDKPLTNHTMINAYSTCGRQYTKILVPI